MKKSRFFAIVLCLMFCIVSSIGCSSGGNNDNSQKANSSDEGKVLQKKEQAKELVYAVLDNDLEFDPAMTYAVESCKIIHNIYDGLLCFNPETGDIQPALAESYQVSDDGKEITFKLRNDVKFHDGTPFNADAVMFTLNRHKNPSEEEVEPILSYEFDYIKSMDKVDDYTIKITMEEPYSPILSDFATTYLGIISPEAYKKYGDKYYENPVGTGPYKFTKYEKGKEIILERNEDYWGEKPKTEKIIIRLAKDHKEIIDGIIDSSIDATSTIDANEINRLEQNKVSIYKTNGVDINYLAFNLENPDLSNIKVREAIVRAINKKELVESIYNGFADVATTFCPPAMVAHDKDVVVYDYDLEKAKSLLKEVGKEGLKLKILAYTDIKQYNTAGSKLGEAVKSYLLKAGFQPELIAKPWKEFKKDRSNGNFDIITLGQISDTCEPDGILSNFTYGSSRNEMLYKNPKVDELVDKGLKLFDINEKAKVYKEVEHILAKDIPAIPISYSVILGAAGNGVKGMKIDRLGFPNFSSLIKEK